MGRFGRVHVCLNQHFSYAASEYFQICFSQSKVNAHNESPCSAEGPNFEALPPFQSVKNRRMKVNALWNTGSAELKKYRLALPSKQSMNVRDSLVRDPKANAVRTTLACSFHLQSGLARCAPWDKNDCNMDSILNSQYVIFQFFCSLPNASSAATKFSGAILRLNDHLVGNNIFTISYDYCGHYHIIVITYGLDFSIF